MKLGYYQPLSGGEAGASGLASLGKTMSDLGQLSLDDKDKKAKAQMEEEKLTLMKNANTRADDELKLNKETLDFKKEESQADRLSKAIKAKNMVGAFRAAHPNATKNFSDDELMAWGNDIDKLLPKDRKIDKIDTRITPEGDKMLTYMEGGVIKERNMGKVKTDWNEKKDKGSSDIPQGWISVGTEFHKEYGHEGNTRLTKDGRYIAPINYVNSMQENQVGGSKKLLDEEL